MDNITVDDNTFESVWFKTRDINRCYSYPDNQYYIVLGGLNG